MLNGTLHDRAEFQGVRLGRPVHGVDLAELDRRAISTALGNSVVGLLLLAGGIFGVTAQRFGTVPVPAIASASAMDEGQASPRDELK